MVGATTGATLRKEREGVGYAQEAVAREMGVSLKTVQRMERRAEVTAKDAREFHSALGRLRDRDTESPVTTVSRGTGNVGSGRMEEERDYIISRVNQAAHRLAIRRAQRAPETEIARLRRELSTAIDNGLEAGSSDPELRALVVRELVALMDRPPMEAGVRERPPVASDTGKA